MKNANHLSKLAFSLTVPALCVWLLAGRETSIEILFGAYTLAGLCYLAMADYTTHRTFHIDAATATRKHRWLRASLHRTPRTRLAPRAEKIHA